MKVCRICMTRENLTSIFSIMDGGRISEKITFVCGLKISSSDAYPKLICHQCLSSIIIASSIKRKSIETENIFKSTWPEESDNQESFSGEEEDPFLIESKPPLKAKYLVYEEDSNILNQPKMNYNLSESSVKISSSNHFNYNPELKRFVEVYLNSKPNLEIVKISDPDCIQDIQRVLSINKDMKIASKRPRLDEFPTIIGRHSTQGSSRLLNALSGRLINSTGSRNNTTGRKNISFH